MKKMLSIMMSILMLLALMACSGNDAEQGENSAQSAEGGDSSETSSDDVIKIGMYMPLTGDSSTLGQNCNNAAQLAIEQINNEGGLLGKQLELICYDDQSSTEQAVKNVSRLIEEDHVNAIIGSLHSGNIKATGDIIEKAEIVEIGTGIAVDWLQQGLDISFQIVG